MVLLGLLQHDILYLIGIQKARLESMGWMIIWKMIIDKKFPQQKKDSSSQFSDRTSTEES